MAAIKRNFTLSSGIGISASNIYVSDTTNSTSSTIGSFVSEGGVGIGKSISISGRLQLFNSSNYTAFVSSASGNTVYTLPATSPATGSSVLQSTSAGVMSWVPMVASGGGAGTVDNGLINSLAYYNATGTAVTGATSLKYTSGVGLSITDTTANIGSTFSGALQVAGGVGIGGTLFVSSAIILNSGSIGLSLQKLVGGNYGAIYSTGVTPSSTNYTMITDGASVNFNGTNGVYFNISNSNKIQVTTNNINITPTAASTSTSTGALTVAGGVGIGGSLYVASATAISGVVINNGIITGNLTGTATTAQNVNVNNASSNAQHTILFSPTATGSGLAVSSNTAISFNPSTLVLSSSGLAVTAGTASTSFSTGALVVTGGVGIGGSVYIQGDLTINGTTTTINSTTLTVDDKNIELGSVSVPSDVTAEGGGITLKGATDKSINWYSGTGWSSNESFNVSSGNSFKINNTSVLNATTLGSTVVSSSLTSVGTIATGSWAATAITAHYGGTGLQSPFVVGDIIYANTTTTWARITAGTAGSILTSAGAGTTPYWAAPAVGSGSTATINNGLINTFPYYNATGTAVTGLSNFVYTGSGIALSFGTNSTSTTTGSLSVRGGVGITGNAFIGGTVTITSSTASTNTSTGALVLAGGLGLTGQLSYNYSQIGSTGIASNPITAFIGTTGSPITLTVLSDNSLLYEGSSGKLFGINNNLSSGWIFNVGDISGLPIIRANADGTIAMAEFAANVGVGISNPTYKLQVSGSAGISGTTSITSSTASTNTTSGAFVVTGGVGIGGSLYVASATGISGVIINNGVVTGNLTGTATTSGFATTASTANSWTTPRIITLAGDLTGNVTWSGSGDTTLTATIAANSVALGTDTTGQYASTLTISGNGITATSAGADDGTAYTIYSSATSANVASSIVLRNVSGNFSAGTITADLSGTATTAQNINVANASTNSAHPLHFSPSATGTGLATSSNTTLSYNPSTLILSTSGLAVTSAIASTSSSSGAFVVTGGVGIGGSLYVASATAISGVTINAGVITGSLTGTATTAGFATTAGLATTATYATQAGYGITAGTATTAQNINVANASSNSAHPIHFSPSATGTGLATSSNTTFSFNPSTFILSTSGLAVTASTASTSASTGALIVTGGAAIGGSLYVNGDLTVNGTTTTINSVTLTVDDKNIEIGSVGSPSDLTAEGGGITLKGASDKSINWYSGTGWSSSESWNVSSGNTYKINNTNVLTSSSLGTGITNSSLTALGTISTGTWSATAITALYGGTGFNSYAVGDILYSNTTTSLAKLTIGASSRILTSTGTAPQWSDPNVVTVGSATTANNINLASIGVTNQLHYITLSRNATGTGVGLSTDSSLTWVDSTGVLSSTIFSGVAITGQTIAGTLVTASQPNVTTMSGLVSIGTIATGSWAATAITAHYGGTGLQSPFVVGDLIYANTTTTWSRVAAGTAGSILTSAGTGATPTWSAPSATVSSSAINSFAYYSSTGTAVTGISNFVQTGSGIALSFGTNSTSTTTGSISIKGGIGLTGNAFIGGTTTILSTTSSTGTSAGSLVNTGGFGNLGNAFIGGTTTITNTTTSTNTTSGALVVSGGVGIGGSLFTATSIAVDSGAFGLSLQRAAAGSLGAIYSTGVTPSSSNYSLATDGTNLNLNSTSNVYINISNTSKFTVSTNNVAVGVNVASTSTTSGAFTVTGGVGIGGSLYVGSATAITGVTFNNGVITGSLAGTATTATNINVVLASSNSSHPVLFTPTSGSASGIAVSSNSTLVYNPSTDRLTVSGLAVTSGTASTNTTTGSLIVNGGIGLTGQLSFNSAQIGSTGIATNPTMAFIGTTGAPITLSVLSDNSLSWEGSSGQLFSIDNNLTSGDIFSVSDISGLPIINASAGQTVSINEFGGYTRFGNGSISSTGASTSAATGALVVYGGFGLTGNAFIGGTTTITNATNSTSTLSGSLVVVGGLGLTGNAFIGGTTTITNAANSISTTSGSLVVSGGLGLTGNAFIGGTTTITNAANSTSTTSGSLVVSGGLGLTGNAFIGGTATITNATNSSSTTSGSLVVSGGLGITGNANIGGTVRITSATNSISTQSGSLVVVGGIGVTGNAFIGSTTTILATTSSTGTSAGSLVNTGGFGNLGNAFIGGTTTITNATNSTSSTSGALVVSGGAGIAKSLYLGSNLVFNGSMYGGTNTYAKNLGAGDVALDNGTDDTPALLYYWGNNKNFGLDVFYSGSGTTKFRIVKELNESGGTELWSLDRNGIVNRTAWDVGEVIASRMYNNSDLNMSATTTINSTTYTNVATITYTPKSSSSYLWIEFDAHYDFNDGTTTDDFLSRITVGGSAIAEKNQRFIGAIGGGTRSGTIFPISGRYTNTSTSGIAITIQARYGTADDNIRIYGSSTSGYMRIQEIGR